MMVESLEFFYLQNRERLTENKFMIAGRRMRGRDS